MPLPPFIIYVDVDDTLIRSVGSKRISLPAVVKHVRELYEQGAVLYCWSSGGAEYAREVAEELGIADCFTAFLPKPHLMIDDQPPSEWRRLRCVHPSACDGRTLEEYRRELREHAATSMG